MWLSPTTPILPQSRGPGCPLEPCCHHPRGCPGWPPAHFQPRHGKIHHQTAAKPPKNQGRGRAQSKISIPLGWAPRSRARSCSTCWHRGGCKGHRVSGDTWVSPRLLARGQGAAKVSPPQPQAGHPGSIIAAVGCSPCLPRPHSRRSPAGGAAGARGCHRPVPTCSRVGARDQGCGAGSWEAPHASGTRSRRASAAARSCAHLDFSRLRSTSLLNQMAKINKYNKSEPPDTNWELTPGLCVS